MRLVFSLFNHFRVVDFDQYVRIRAQKEPKLLVNIFCSQIVSHAQVLKLSLNFDGLEIALASFNIFALCEDFLPYNWRRF